MSNLYRQDTADFVHAEGILYRKSAISGAAEAVEEGAAAEGFAKVACQGSDVCAFGAVHEDFSLGKSGRKFSDVYPG